MLLNPYRFGSGPAAWSPAALSPVIWLDDESTITDVSGYASVVYDRGTQGSDFSQTNSSLRPQIINSLLAGRRGLRFDGSSQFLQRTMNSLMRNTASAQVFSVYKRRSSSTGYRRLFSVVHDFPSLNNTRFGAFVGHATAGKAPWLQTEGVGGGSEVNLEATLSLDPTAWGFHFFQRDFAGGGAALWSNGTLQSQLTGLLSANSTNIANTRDIYIGCYQAGTQFGDIDLVCLIVMQGTVIGTDDRQRLEGWAAWRYGLEGSLPSGHPYESAPP